MNPGDTISRYRIVGPLGKGGMGVVYQADDTRLNRPVALKFLPSDSLSPQDRFRFLNEAQAAAAARHPNICPIYDIEDVDGVSFIVMACLEGETLQRRIRRGPLEVGQAIDIAIQVASGLDCAHELGIIHRDIKSANIIVSPDCHASILDFGLALVSGETRLTTDGQTVGTAFYMSPEQAQGQTVDRRSDIWSLGVVLFEMVTGVLPFRREHAAAALHAVLYDPIPDVTALRPGVPPELVRAIEKALTRDLKQRWQSAAEMGRELKRIQTLNGSASQEAEHAPTQAMERGPVAAKAVRPRRGVLAVCAGVALAGAFGIYYFGNRGRAPDRGAAVLPASQNKQVAVLPFQVIGGAESTRTVADGLVEILAAALSDFERFQGSITAIPSGEIRRRSIASPEEARRIYGVSMVITGSALPAGENIQFTLNLVDAATLRQIGAKTFVYEVKNPVASRNQAVEMVVGLMKADLAPATRTAIAAGDTAAPDAYSAYLKGRGLMARFDVSGNIDKAIASFSDAIRQDPKYALAYAGLGEAYWRKSGSGDREAARLARSNAERAVQLDPNLALVHSVLGAIYGEAGMVPEAVAEFQKAMQLAPGNAEAPRQLASIYAANGRFQEAEALYQQAIRSRPTDWFGHYLLGIFYYQRERYAESEAALNRAKALTPDNDRVSRDLGSIYRMHGRYREAIEEFQHTLKIASNARTYGALAGAYFFEHRFAEAVTAGEAALDLDSTDYRYFGNLGAYYKWAPGNEAKAPAALRRAIELATKVKEARPNDNDVRANLAEYYARLGDGKTALAEIEKIPTAARKPLTTRLALAYELTGHREQAVDVVRTNFSTAASLNQIKDDPDLSALWKDAKFQQAIQTTANKRQN